MTEVYDHRCPYCKSALGSLRTLKVGKGEVTDGVKENTHTICVICQGFLRILSYSGGRAQVQAMTDDEILALPDRERMALARLGRSLIKRDPKELQESMEKHTRMKEKFEALEDDIMKELESRFSAHFGQRMAMMLIVKDPRDLGFQGMLSNSASHHVEEMLRRALAEYDGTMLRLVKEMLGVDGE